MSSILDSKLTLATILSLTLITATSTIASPIVLDFENHAGMGYASGSPITEAAKLSDDYLSLYGVAFSSGSSFVAVVNLGQGHATSGTKGVGGSTAEGILIYNPANPIMATFFNPSNTTQMATTDFVSLRADLWADTGSILTLEGYNIFGQLIASNSVLDSAGVMLNLSAPGIHSVQFKGKNVAIDDFTFNAVSPIPEPGTISFMGLSSGILLFTRKLRRRKKAGMSLMPIRRKYDDDISFKSSSTEMPKIECTPPRHMFKKVISEKISEYRRHVANWKKSFSNKFWDQLISLDGVMDSFKKKALGYFGKRFFDC